jgi:uncharacterized coiled-coil DUF342 family protein
MNVPDHDNHKSDFRPGNGDRPMRRAVKDGSMRARPEWSAIADARTSAAGPSASTALSFRRSVGTSEEVIATLATAERELRAMAQVVDREIGTVAKAFETLAGYSDAIIALAAAIVASMEKENVSSLLPRVQTLGGAARNFIDGRLHATAGILETVTAEVRLLHQLSLVTRSQEAIAAEIKALSVLTNIEVAHLGTVGAGFQYLARELADFSKSVSADTRELASRTNDRRSAIEKTKRVLLAEIPRLRERLIRIEIDLTAALAIVDTSLTQLSGTPAQFRTCVEDIARQIAAVVAAIQTHDINRQMNEHVHEAFALMIERLTNARQSEAEVLRELATSYAGLRIQIAQMKSIAETVGQWTAQIRSCMNDILRLSTSEIFGVGRAVLEQERKVTKQLACIEALEGEGQAYSEKTQHSVAGLSNLMQLVTEHVQRAESVRDRLRLLAFNSIVEASHLGTKADAILSISKSIKEISAEWTQITDRSQRALQEILQLVKQTNEMMEAFSEASNQGLNEAQINTRAGLDNLKSAANFTTSRAMEMQIANQRMQTKILDIGRSGDLLDASFGRADAVMKEIESLRLHLEIYHPGVREAYNDEEVEKLFSVSYTTEREREVLGAALKGVEPPTAQQALEGNSAELF